MARTWSSPAGARASVREILEETVREARRLRSELERFEEESPRAKRAANAVFVYGFSTAALVDELDEVLKTYLREYR
jgi:hypothetical protein